MSQDRLQLERDEEAERASGVLPTVKIFKPVHVECHRINPEKQGKMCRYHREQAQKRGTVMKEDSPFERS
jgi:hypothetical protein